MAGESLGELWVDIRGRLDGLDKDLKTAQSRLQSWGTKMSSVGQGLTRGVTLPLLGLGAAAVNASLTFNKGMANIATLIPGNVERVGELKKSVQDLAIGVGASTADLTGGLYQVISAFGDTADSVKILETNARAARAGLASTTDAINLTSAVTKAYGDTSAAAVKKVSDLALLTVRLGQTTFPELASSIGRVTGMANSMGVSQQELFGVFATFTGVIGSAAEVSTAFTGVLKGLQKPSAEMAKAITAMGYATGEAALKALGLNGVLQGLTKYSETSGVRMADMVTEVEALKLLLPATSTQAQTLTDKIAAMGTEADITGQAFDAATTGINKTGFAYDRLKVSATVALQKIGDAIGEALDPETVEQLTASLNGLLKAFADLKPETKVLLIKAVAVVVALGPIVTAVNAVIKVFGTLATAWGWIAGTGTPALAASFGSLASKAAALNPIGVIAVTALAAWNAFANDNLWARLKADFAGFGKWVAASASAAARAFAGMVNSIIASGARVSEALRRLTSTSWIIRLIVDTSPVLKAISWAGRALESLRNRTRSASAFAGATAGKGLTGFDPAFLSRMGLQYLPPPASLKELESLITSLGEATSWGSDKNKENAATWQKLQPILASMRTAQRDVYLEQQGLTESTSKQIESLLLWDESAQKLSPTLHALLRQLLEFNKAQEASNDAARLMAWEYEQVQAAIEKRLEAQAQGVRDAEGLRDWEYAQVEAHMQALLDASRQYEQARLDAAKAAAQAQVAALGGIQLAAQAALDSEAKLRDEIAALGVTLALAGSASVDVLKAAGLDPATLQLASYRLEDLRVQLLDLLQAQQQAAAQAQADFDQAMRGAVDPFLIAGQGVIETLTELGEKVTPTIRSLSDLAAAAFVGMKVTAQDAVGVIMQSLDKLGVKSNSVFGRLLGAAGAFFAGGGGLFGIISGVGKLFGLAEGGTITSSGLALVGERGPEVLSLPRGAQVAPLAAAGAGAGTVQNITLMLDSKVLTRTVVRGMPGELRLYGAAR